MTDERVLASYYDRDLRKDVALIARESPKRTWYVITDGQSSAGFNNLTLALRHYNARKAQHQGE